MQKTFDKPVGQMQKTLNNPKDEVGQILEDIIEDALDEVKEENRPKGVQSLRSLFNSEAQNNV